MRGKHGGKRNSSNRNTGQSGFDRSGLKHQTLDSYDKQFNATSQGKRRASNADMSVLESDGSVDGNFKITKPARKVGGRAVGT